MTRLSTMTQDQRDRFDKYWNDVLLTGKMGFKMMEPKLKFDKWGLRFPSEYLRSVGISIIMLPLEKMAEYCDAVAKRVIDENDTAMLEEMRKSICGVNDVKEVVGKINATSIGNLAYACLYCKDELLRVNIEDFLQKVLVYQKGQLLNSINENLL